MEVIDITHSVNASWILVINTWFLMTWWRQAQIYLTTYLELFRFRQQKRVISFQVWCIVNDAIQFGP